jgi:hypothetical protein
VDTVDDDEILDLRPPHLRTPSESPSVSRGTISHTRAKVKVSAREKAPGNRKVELVAPDGFFRRDSFYLTPERQPPWHIVKGQHGVTYVALCGYERDFILDSILRMKRVVTVNIICGRCRKIALEKEKNEREREALDRVAKDQGLKVDSIDEGLPGQGEGAVGDALLRVPTER